MFVKMNYAIEQNGLRPIIDSVFPFERSVEALHYLAKGSYSKVPVNGCFTISYKLLKLRGVS
ncbi:hypothetical protein [Paenibacillus albidus]|nr:hypothetical protein [Paenibacillus albidus]